jgi:hypothetical protein
VKHVFLTDQEATFFDERTEEKPSEDLIFKRDDGEPWAKSNQQPRMKAVLKAAGIRRHVRFHDLRHTFATLLALNGTSIQLIANQLGHSGTRIAKNIMPTSRRRTWQRLSGRTSLALGSERANRRRNALEEGEVIRRRETRFYVRSGVFARESCWARRLRM